MAKVKYIGIHDEVTLELPSGERVTVKNGDTIETTPEQAGALIKTTSSMWEHVKGRDAAKEQ